MSENYFAEQAVSIDHILESILSNLKINDLTQTRLVSRRLNHFSCRKIELILLFWLDAGSIDPSKDRSIVGTNSSGPISRGSVEEFISTLRTANRFPCTIFSLCVRNICNQRVQSFVALQGCYVRTLFLCLIDIYPQNIVSYLTYLLMETMPNLQNLTLEVQGHICFYNPRNEFLLEPPNKDWILPNLKSLSVLNATNQIFALLVTAAVNLQEYIARNDYFVNYFTKYPGNSRLHLLKELYVSGLFFPVQNYLNELELISGLLATKMEFRIRVLHLELDYILRNHQDALPRVSLVINKIFHSIFETVEEIFLQPIGFLVGIRLPVFRKLSQLVLKYYCNLGRLVCIEECFPGGFIEISRMFPILKILVVCKYIFRSAAPFNFDANSTIWKPVDRNYKDFHGISKYEWTAYQVFERAY